MNNLVGYSFKDQILRTQLSDNGEPLFCLADVCEALELTNPSSVASSIKEEFSCPKLNLGQVDDPTGKKTAIFITEPQLYYVLMRSKAKKARPFRQWVVNEVLPSIRKNGYYNTTEQKEIGLRELKDKLELASMVLSSSKPQELDAYYKALTGESILEKIKENTTDAN